MNILVSNFITLHFQRVPLHRDVFVIVEAAEPMVGSTEFDRKGLDGWKAGEPGVGLCTLESS